MKIKLSQSQWNQIGKTAGWLDEIGTIEGGDINWAEFNNEWEAVKSTAKLDPKLLEEMKEYAQMVAEKYSEGTMGSKKGNLINANLLAEDIAKHFNRLSFLRDDDSDIWGIVAYISDVWGKVGERKEEGALSGINEEEEITLEPDVLEQEINKQHESALPELPPLQMASKKVDNVKVAKILSVKLVEAKKKGKKVNPWAVCHTTVDKDKNPEKYEKCVKDVKKEHPIKKD